MYESTHTKQDMNLAVSFLSQIVDSARQVHVVEGKRTLKYLVGCAGHRIDHQMSTMNLSDVKALEVYSGIQSARDLASIKTISRRAVLYREGFASWRSFMLKCVADLRTEAELIALSEFIEKICRYRRILFEICQTRYHTPFFEDS